jgi:hypothetical protein
MAATSPFTATSYTGTGATQFVAVEDNTYTVRVVNRSTTDPVYVQWGVNGAVLATASAIWVAPGVSENIPLGSHTQRASVANGGLLLQAAGGEPYAVYAYNGTLL